VTMAIFFGKNWGVVGTSDLGSPDVPTRPFETVGFQIGPVDFGSLYYANLLRLGAFIRCRNACSLY
jgi:hypothetical protein